MGVRPVGSQPVWTGRFGEALTPGLAHLGSGAGSSRSCSSPLSGLMRPEGCWVACARRALAGGCGSGATIPLNLVRRMAYSSTFDAISTPRCTFLSVWLRFSATCEVVPSLLSGLLSSGGPLILALPPQNLSQTDKTSNGAITVNQISNYMHLCAFLGPLRRGHRVPDVPASPQPNDLHQARAPRS